jgi:hypothetical protein
VSTDKIGGNNMSDWITDLAEMLRVESKQQRGFRLLREELIDFFNDEEEVDKELAVFRRITLKNPESITAKCLESDEGISMIVEFVSYHVNIRINSKK